MSSSKVKSIKFLGKKPTYDLEISHKDHQFYLSNGILSGNSHATLYSMTTFKTAYLKAHYFLEFMVANLIADVGSNSPKARENIAKIKQEIRERGVKILPPDINRSDVAYKIIDDNTLVTGMDSLRNVKPPVVEEIKRKRPFSSFKDLIVRTDSSIVRSPAIQSLAAVGALDSFGVRREHMFFYCSDFRKKYQALKTSLGKKVQKGTITQEEMDAELDAFEYPFPEDERKWEPYEVFALEEHFLGEGLSGTLADRFPGFFDRYKGNLAPILEMFPKFNPISGDEREIRRANTYILSNYNFNGVKGVVEDVFEFRVKKEDSAIFGQLMAYIRLRDFDDQMLSVVCFPDAWNNAQDRVNRDLTGGKGKIERGVALHIDGAFQWKSESEYSFILGEVISYGAAPKPPKSLKAKSVKIPRRSKKTLSKSDIVKMSREELVQEVSDDLALDGVSFSPSDDDEYVF